MENPYDKNQKTKVIMYVLLLVIFYLDTITPLGFAIGYFYIPALCIFAVYLQLKKLCLMAIIITALILMGGFLGNAEGIKPDSTIWIANRVSSIIALFSTLYLIFLAKGKIERLVADKSIVRNILDQFGLELLTINLSKYTVEELSNADGLLLFKAKKREKLHQYFDKFGDKNKKYFLSLLRKVEVTDTRFEFESPTFTINSNEDLYRVQGYQTAPLNYTCIVQNISNYKFDKVLYKVLDSLPCFTWVASSVGEIIFANHKLLAKAGYNFEYFQKNWKLFFSSDDVACIEKEWRDASNNKRRGSASVRFKDSTGSYIQLALEFFPIYDHNDDISKWFGTGVDVSRLVDLENQNTIFSQVADTTTDAALMITYVEQLGHYKANYVNKSFEDSIGFELSDIFDKNIIDWLNTCLKSEYNLEDNLSLSKPLDINGRFLATFGSKQFNVEVTTLPLDISNTEFVLIFKDRTIQHQLDTILERDSRLDSIGQVAGGMAHDFNNLLSVISGNLELAKLENVNETALKNIENAALAAMQGARLTSSLLIFASGKEESASEVCNISSVIQSNIELYTSIVAEFGKLTVHTLDGLYASIPQSQIESIIINLISNSRDPIIGIDCGEVSLIVQEEVLSSSKARVLGCDPGEYIKITVSDNGHGMAQEQLRHIFTPFFTGKSKLQGTGLGLSMVYAYVRQNRGAIDVESTLGTGTTFNIFLKQVHESSGLGTIPFISENRTNHSDYTGEVAVLVEDKVRVAEVARRHLQDFGFEVKYYPSGEHALSAELSPRIVK